MNVSIIDKIIPYLKHKFANEHNRKVSLHKNIGRTSMLDSIPIVPLHMLIEQQTLKI